MNRLRFLRTERGESLEKITQKEMGERLINI